MDKIDQLFQNLENQWNVSELEENHYDRFIAKQQRKNIRLKYWTALSIAATVLLLVGFFTFFNERNSVSDKTSDLQFASKQTRETDSIFTALIRIELEKIKQKKSPVSEKMISDALIQMQDLDNDYEKLKKELIKNGESKQIIQAMIRNLQTRISFLEEVLKHIENTENFNSSTHENTI